MVSELDPRGITIVEATEGAEEMYLRRNYARSLLAGAVLTATMFGAVNTAAQPTDNEPIGLLFKVHDQLVTLSDGVRDALTNRANTIVRSCNYDAGDREERLWREALAEPSSIRLIYTVPMQLGLPRRELLISEVVFSLRDPDFLGSPILHHAGRITLVFKCSGTDMLKLMCMPELESHFPPGYQENCHIVRRM